MKCGFCVAECDTAKKIMSTLKAKTAGAVAILEHYTCNDPVHERNASKRALADVTLLRVFSRFSIDGKVRCVGIF